MSEIESVLSAPGVAREMRIDRGTLTRKLETRVIAPDFIDAHTGRVFFRVARLPELRSLLKPATNIPDIAA